MTLQTGCERTRRALVMPLLGEQSRWSPTQWTHETCLFVDILEPTSGNKNVSVSVFYYVTASGYGHPDPMAPDVTEEENSHHSFRHNESHSSDHPDKSCIGQSGQGGRDTTPRHGDMAGGRVLDAPGAGSSGRSGMTKQRVDTRAVFSRRAGQERFSKR